MISPRAAAPRHPTVHHDADTGRTVFVAPGRDERPDDATLAAAHGGGTAAAWCPFCAGNESRTPPDILRAPAEGAPWQARIIPNRYPFVGGPVSNGPHITSTAALADQFAHGAHDVVIESPRHDTSVAAIDAAGWRAAWGLVQRRLADLAGRGDLAWGTVFKNSGPLAGASLEHVHSQLVAVDFLPPAVRAEYRAVAEGPRTDPFADLLSEARSSGRIVREVDGLVALVPPAPRQPGETWIVPAAREPFFHAAASDRATAVADLTRDLVARLDRMLGGADYNWWLHEAAWASADELATAALERWHWHLEILPRVTHLAGFELATGCHITAVPAVEAAARLRDA